MRAGVFIIVATGAVTVLGCYKPKPPDEMHPVVAMQSVAMPPPPSPSQKKPNDVSIVVNCPVGDTLSYRVDPWLAIIPEKEKSITWTLSSDENKDKTDSVYIVRKNDATWAFDEKDIKVKKGSVTVKLKSSAVTDFVYKYNIVATCHGSVITIDPDMIIPKGTT